MILTETAAERLVTAGWAVGHPAGHPLSAVTVSTYSQQMRRLAGEYAGLYGESLPALKEAAQTFASAVGAEGPGSRAEYERAARTAAWVHALSGFPESWVRAEEPGR